MKMWRIERIATPQWWLKEQAIEQEILSPERCAPVLADYHTTKWQRDNLWRTLPDRAYQIIILTNGQIYVSFDRYYGGEHKIYYRVLPYERIF